MLKQSLSQKMLQKLSPQQIQLMKLLQIPTASLDERIEEELEINPALEDSREDGDYEGPEEELYRQDETPEEATPKSDDGFEFEDYLNQYMDDDPASYKLQGDNYNGDEEEKVIPIAEENTFHEYLEQQLGLLNLKDDRERNIALQIIGSIDEDGYLRRDPLSIMDDLLFSQNVFTTEAEVFELLKKIQQFDPSGVGARDLQECLCIQLKSKLEQEEHLTRRQKRRLRLALQIIEEFFDEFTKKHYPKLQKNLEASEEELKEALDEILKLNPKPASGYVGNVNRNVQYVIPDFILLNNNGDLELSLNSKNAPELRISSQYLDMMRDYRARAKGGKSNAQQKEAVQFIKQKIDSAKWFIDAIHQRQQTMFNTMYAITKYQEDYFLTGDSRKLRPMILKDIADITSLDISTISRVVNNKFVQTEFGVKRLKEFFSEALQTSDGEEVSTIEVKKILQELIGDEDKQKPLSDERLTEILQEKGYNIARRTVAKYREQLNLSVARLRKEL
ncbi:MAG: RNA polymerase factor sigma-54 [Saprospiraceae bacterium]|nr:RNA polymerase factor sigma-54 [Saprospiraceae bacterium]MDZ4704657.1 RNA polymerase factor sigma-54 [Saprospiraceae bacterium]